MNKAGWIEPEILKRETCESRGTGIPSEALGELLLSMARKVAGIYFADRSCPYDRDEAIGQAALKCWEGSARIQCDLPAASVFHFYNRIAINTFRDQYRSHYDRRRIWKKYLAEMDASSIPVCDRDDGGERY